MTPRPASMTALALYAVMLAGCATIGPVSPASGGATSSRIGASPDMRSYSLALGHVASGGAPKAQVTPMYPAALLATCPASVEVPARLIIDRGGQVTEVRVAGEAAAGADRRAFIDAVRTAAMQWSFQPLQVARWAADADGNSHVVDSEALPYSLGYRFHFTCRGGRTQVSADAAAPASPR